MRRFLTLSLLWLIALAMPLQGAAAVSMTLCGPVHQRMMEGQAETQSVGHASIHADVDHAAHHAHTGETTPDHSKSDHSKSVGCSACSACCLGGAVATGYVLPDLYFASINPVSLVISSYAGVVADGPEHPPRILLI